ncbi:hypothetical protein GCM10010264_69410 [Streptomyces globisporus]|nr:hypothetical protein GCM10010264_69410 [Streptomyces globisporus]
MVRVGGERENPQVALQIYPGLSESPAGQLLQMTADIFRQRCQTSVGELAQTVLRGSQVTDTVGELVVDLPDSLLEGRVVR